MSDHSELSPADPLGQQFDRFPFPHIPIEDNPRQLVDALSIHNWITPYYLRHQRLPDRSDRVILDAGCGSGYKALMLAYANPEARIIGIDLSEQSVKMARQRAAYHNITQAEFHTLSITDLSSLGLTFDYINCDETLYLLPDPVAGLAAMKAVLKPTGIIRANLHSHYGRFPIHRVQELLRLLGLLHDRSGADEVQIVVETVKSLRPDVTPHWCWDADFFEPDGQINSSRVQANYLLHGDKGFTITQLFDLLRATDLEFISMVDWRSWELRDLFQQGEDLPLFWELTLSDLSPEAALVLHELMFPTHRLLDFWCGHPAAAKPTLPVYHWTNAEWEQAVIQLHPQLNTVEIRDHLVDCITQRHPFVISQYIPAVTKTPIILNPAIAATLLPLWQTPQSIAALVQRWLTLYPVEPISLQPCQPDWILQQLKDVLIQLENALYVLIETP